MIRVLAVDDHPLMRQGIASLLDASDDIRLVAEASNGLEAVALFDEHLPDVTLMDLQMAGLDGTSATRHIVARHPTARILVLTTYKGDVQARRAFAAGACGYLLKNAIRRELLDAIRNAHAGHRQIPAEVASELGRHAFDEPLSARELDVLHELTLRGSNREIAGALGLSEDTVKTHMKNILSKLNATDRTQAVIVAIRRGIIDINA